MLLGRPAIDELNAGLKRGQRTSRSSPAAFPAARRGRAGSGFTASGNGARRRRRTAATRRRGSRLLMAEYLKRPNSRVAPPNSVESRTPGHDDDVIVSSMRVADQLGDLLQRRQGMPGTPTPRYANRRSHRGDHRALDIGLGSPSSVSATLSRMSRMTTSLSPACALTHSASTSGLMSAASAEEGGRTA